MTYRCLGTKDKQQCALHLGDAYDFAAVSFCPLSQKQDTGGVADSWSRWTWCYGDCVTDSHSPISVTTTAQAKAARMSSKMKLIQPGLGVPAYRIQKPFHAANLTI
jgi:hypothetical protein